MQVKVTVPLTLHPFPAPSYHAIVPFPAPLPPHPTPPRSPPHPAPPHPIPCHPSRSPPSPTRQPPLHCSRIYISTLTHTHTQPHPLRTPPQNPTPDGMNITLHSYAILPFPTSPSHFPTDHAYTRTHPPHAGREMV